jgi:hexokinase
MAHRLANILDHIAANSRDSDEMKHLKQRIALESLRAQFHLSEDRLKEMVYFMIHEMHQGLAGRPSTLRMLPSYVYRKNISQAEGVYYALDLGGTNFRVIRMLIRQGKLISVAQSQFVIPKEHMEGNHVGLFGFIASSVLKFVQEKGQDDQKGGAQRTIPLGFTFSFPVKQTSVNEGSLIKWTKGFKTSGVEGNDIVQLLQAALDKVNVDVRIVALCNDTVGTLVARYFSDEHTQMGVILGTGANACYWERASAVTKDGKVAKEGAKETVVNMEFGNFDSTHVLCLPSTPFDDAIDKASINPGEQRFEKMISGMYLGEIARQVLVSLSKNGLLPESVAKGLSTPYAFESRYSGLISADHLPGLFATKKILQANFSVTIDKTEDLFLIRNVCVLVRNRAAQLAGMAISATLLKSETTGNATVAVDGSVYEKTPSFRAVMQKTIRTILGDESDVRLVLQREGSGHGAGFIAALSA